ncbi:MAG: winged helix-turn-helix transcriptional regulator [Planctomycetaceae bacterium]|nr:winged helix-turn-helix transcriptional regulator [Planctomycetaceae bacterium]
MRLRSRRDATKTPADSLSQWILDELGRTGSFRRSQISARTGRSSSTVRRALAELRDAGQVVFEGSARAGSWRLV